MSSDSTLLDILNAKPKPAAHVPTIGFDLPPITPSVIVNNVFHDKGGWKTIGAVLAEADNERKARRFREKYEMTEIPQPQFESEDL
jgi:hypothetical protein